MTGRVKRKEWDEERERDSLGVTFLRTYVGREIYRWC